MSKVEQNMPPVKLFHTMESQKSFAELSGDFNPVHLDPVQARRTMFGQVVVHGVHNVMCALESFLNNRPYRIERLAVSFKNPAYLNEEVTVTTSTSDHQAALLTLLCKDTVVAEIRLRGKTLEAVTGTILLEPSPFPRQAENKTWRRLEEAQGSIKLMGEETALSRAFPNCIKSLGIDGAARLLGLTRLVGMHCPGLHSLFSGFDITFSAERSSEATRYRTIRADERISLLTIAVEGGGMKGTVSAFRRPIPVEQPNMESIRKYVKGAPFKGQRALIIGGSRGLGEVSAKIIAAGGGDVAVSYLTGKEDAQRVADDISRFAGPCQILQIDVSKPADRIDSLCKSGWVPSHLLYFATPRISSRKSDTEKDNFREIYSEGLKNVITALRKCSLEPLKLFYPSSIFVADPPADLTDYAAAKADGENTVNDLAKSDPGLSVTIERLPPLATDQTASLLNVAVDDSLETMARVLGKALC